MHKKYFIKFTLLLGLLVIISGCGNRKSVDEPNTEQSTTQESETISEETTTEYIPTDYAFTTTVSINPQIKLYLDIENYILGAEYLNDDAKDAYADLKLKGLILEDGMEQIVTAAIEKQYLKEGMDISITIDDVTNQDVEKDNLLFGIKDDISQLLDDSNVTATIVVNSDSQDNEQAEIQNQSSEQESTMCSRCGGSGECVGCHGGKDKCPACNGTGYETCPMCDENGLDHGQTCATCGGTHHYLCTHCKGVGTAIDCPECGGTFKCQACGGTGIQK